MNAIHKGFRDIVAEDVLVLVHFKVYEVGRLSENFILNIYLVFKIFNDNLCRSHRLMPPGEETVVSRFGLHLLCHLFFFFEALVYIDLVGDLHKRICGRPLTPLGKFG